MRSNYYRLVSLMWCVMQPLSSSENFPDAEMTRSSGVIPGLMMYFFVENCDRDSRGSGVFHTHYP